MARHGFPKPGSSSPASRTNTDRPRAALAWMAGSAVLFSVMGLLVKVLSPGIPQFQVVFFRAFVNFLLVLAVMLGLRESLWSRKQAKLLFFRGVAGFSGLSCLFYSLEHLPLSIAMMLQWSSPLFVILFSRLFLKERLPSGSLIAICAAFGGTSLLFGRGTPGQGLSAFAILIGIVGSASAGLAYVAVRAATSRVSVWIITLYFSGVSAALSLPLALKNWVGPSPLQWLELVAVGTSGAVAQVMMTQAYRFAPAGPVSVMSLLGAAVSAGFGWIFFEETLTALQWLGIATLGLAVAWLGSRSRP